MAETVSVKNATLVVEAGSVWVTRSGVAEDRLFHAGQTIELWGSGWVVGPVGTSLPCRFTLEPRRATVFAWGRPRTMAAWA